MAGTKRPIIIAIVLLTLIFIASQLSYAASPQGKLQKDVADAKAACANSPYKEGCYSETFSKLTTETNMTYAFDVLRALQKVDTGAIGCHFIAHSIS